jgi:hypothetical protein
VCGIGVDYKYFPNLFILQYSRLSQQLDKLHSLAYDAVSIGKYLSKVQRNFPSVNVGSITLCMQKHYVCVCRYLDITGTQDVRKAVS